MKRDFFMPRDPDRLASRVARAAIALVWIYQGLVPKLLGPHADELLLTQALGVTLAQAASLVKLAGWMEIGLGSAVWLLPAARWPLLATGVAPLLLLVYVGWAAPGLMLAAFNPVVTNVLMTAMSLIALLLQGQRD